MMRRLLPIACVLALAGCSESEPAEPPHEPVLPTPILPEEDPEPPSEETADPADPEQPPEGQAAKRAPVGKTASDRPKPDEPSAKAKPKARPKPAADPKPAASPQPAKAAPTEPKEPATDESSRTRIPRTEHVQVDVTAKMQERLDSDSRMQGWVDKVMAVANQCYAKVRAQKPEAGGTIVVRVTMHENSRPSPDITQLPPALSDLVACATGRLFNVRMPLFTGPEGEKHVVKLRFKP